MKKIIATLLLIAALAVSTPAYASETVTCSTNGQYGGSTCGISTSTEETKVVHTIGAGIGDWTLAQIIAFTGISAVVATILYKKTYRLYIFG
jgi:hypothetical protein